MSEQVSVKVEGKYVVVKFVLKDKYLKDLDDMLEHHTSRRLTKGEQVQVVRELLRNVIEDMLDDWTWFLVDKTRETIDIANDVIEEADNAY